MAVTEAFVLPQALELLYNADMAVKSDMMMYDNAHNVCQFDIIV